MIPWYAMPARTKEEREARHKAKAEFEAAHPLATNNTPRKVGGGFVAPNGAFHPATTRLEKKVAQWLIYAGHTPIPPYLRIKEDGREAFFIGRSGARYPCWPITPRTLTISLDFAETEEERVCMQQGSLEK